MLQKKGNNWQVCIFGSVYEICLYFTLFTVKILSSKVKQPVNLILLAKLNKIRAECLQMLSQGCGEDCMSRMPAFV